MIRKRLVSVGLWVLLGAAVAQEPKGVAEVPFKSERDKASYAYGMNIGRTWKEGRVDLDPEGVVRGLKDALSKGPTLLTEAQMAETLARFGRQLRIAQQQHRERDAEDNRKLGDEFLVRNKLRPGVMSLPSGLQYEVIVPGKGQSPDLTNWVRLNYRGTRLDGHEFESSVAHPEASIFSLRSVIPGWAEALQLMKSGAKWRLFLPPSLAYGQNGSPEAGPNETLIYDMELVSVLSGPPQPTAEEIKNERAPDGD